MFGEDEADDPLIQGFFCNKCKYELHLTKEMRDATEASECDNVTFYRVKDVN